MTENLSQYAPFEETIYRSPASYQEPFLAYDAGHIGPTGIEMREHTVRQDTNNSTASLFPGNGRQYILPPRRKIQMLTII